VYTKQILWHVLTVKCRVRHIDVQVHDRLTFNSLVSKNLSTAGVIQRLTISQGTKNGQEFLPMPARA
jgi:hypothetical protein